MAFKARLRQALAAVCFLAVAGPALAETVTYTYDARGRLATASYSTGHTTTYSYDAAGNRTQLAVSGGSGGSNQAPDAVNDYDTWVAYVPAARTVNVLANDTDPDSNPLTITSVSTPSSGARAVIEGNVIWVDNIQFYTQITFTYTVSDGHENNNQHHFARS